VGDGGGHCGREGEKRKVVGSDWIGLDCGRSGDDVMDTTGYRAAEPRCVFWQQRGAERHGHGSCE